MFEYQELSQHKPGYDSDAQLISSDVELDHTRYNSEVVDSARQLIAEQINDPELSVQLMDRVGDIEQFGGWHEYDGSTLLVRTAEIIQQCDNITRHDGAPEIVRKAAASLVKRSIGLVDSAAKINELLKDSDSNSPEIDLQEIARVQRDFYYTVRAINLILQSDESIASAYGYNSSDYMDPEDYTHLTAAVDSAPMPVNEGRFFSFEVCNHSYNPEGDFIDLPQEDLNDIDEFQHRGKIKLFIREQGKNARICFTYLPYQESASAHYESEVTQWSEGRQETVKHIQRGFRISIDRDSLGMSVDVARGAWDGVQFKRKADTGGKVFDHGSGSHDYKAFSEDDIKEWHDLVLWVTNRAAQTTEIMQTIFQPDVETSNRSSGFEEYLLATLPMEYINRPPN